jgi:hypothetical protein
MFKPSRVATMFNALVCNTDEKIHEPTEFDSASAHAEFQGLIFAFRGLPSRICLAARFISERVGDARQIPVLPSIIEYLAQHDAGANAGRDMQ